MLGLKSKSKQYQLGFSIFEIIVVLVVGGILIAGISGTFLAINKLHLRQTQIVAMDREIMYAQMKLGRIFRNLPGRQISYYNGFFYSQPSQLPILSVQNSPNLALGLVTPINIGGNDGAIVITGTHDLPRMELVGATTISGTIGTAVVATSKLINPQVGDLMMLVGWGGYFNKQANVPAKCRIIRVTAVSRKFVGTQGLLEIKYDLCSNGTCSNEFPGLTNNDYAPASFGIGSALIPINLSFIYLSKQTPRNQLVQNVGGTLVLNSSGNYDLIGGVNTPIGDIDSVVMSYTLGDGTTQNTPAPGSNPNWLNSISAVNVVLKSSFRVPNGTVIERSIPYSFSLKSEALNN